MIASGTTSGQCSPLVFRVSGRPSTTREVSRLSDIVHLVGPTPTGRVLSIIVGAVPNQTGAYDVFTARPASRSERRLYERQKGA